MCYKQVRFKIRCLLYRFCGGIQGHHKTANKPGRLTTLQAHRVSRQCEIFRSDLFYYLNGLANGRYLIQLSTPIWLIKKVHSFLECTLVLWCQGWKASARPFSGTLM